jgi:hypothetical protein
MFRCHICDHLEVLHLQETMASSSTSDNATLPSKGNFNHTDIEKQATNESYVAPVAAPPPKTLGAGVSPSIKSL